MTTIDQKNLAFLDFSLFMYSIPSIEIKVVNEVLEKLSELISEQYIPFLKNELLDDLTLKGASSEICGAVKVFLELNDSPVYILNTKFKRESTFKKLAYIPPERFPIEYEIVTKFLKDEDNFKYPVNVKVPRYATYVSITESLQTLFENPSIYGEIMIYLRALSEEKKEGYISNIMQGVLWDEIKQNYQEHQLVLPLLLFLDDFQPLNALGSHNLQQKLTALYIACPFLPPELMNKPENIFLSMIFRQKYSKLFEKEKFFRKLIEELNTLSKLGLLITTNGFPENIFFQLVLVIGDNLALNDVLGFSGSFTATHYCRLCRENNLFCGFSPYVTQAELRTVKNYQEDLIKKESGVKEECIFNSVDNYYVTKNQSQDFMHDGPEGLIHYSLKNTLVGLIEKDFLFSVDDLNTAIAQFPYGVNESNVPQPIAIEPRKNKKNLICHLDKKCKYRQSASESLCLARYLGLIIGHKVPIDNKYWKVYLILNKIVRILTSPKLRQSDLDILEDLVIAHNQAYLTLFGEMPPKLHFIGHYSQNIKRIGPPRCYWSFPFERKNKELKSYIASNHCFIDLPFTIASRIQLTTAFARQKSLLKPSKYLFGPPCKDIDDKISCIFPDTQYFMCNSFVKFSGNIYKPGVAVILRFVNGEPIVGLIEVVVKLREECVGFFFNILEIVDINRHVCAAIARQTYKYEFCLMNEVLLLSPLLIVKLTDSSYYIASKYYEF